MSINTTILCALVSLFLHVRMFPQKEESLLENTFPSGRVSSRLFSFTAQPVALMYKRTYVQGNRVYNTRLPKKRANKKYKSPKQRPRSCTFLKAPKSAVIQNHRNPHLSPRPYTQLKYHPHRLLPRAWAAAARQESSRQHSNVWNRPRMATAYCRAGQQ